MIIKSPWEELVYKDVFFYTFPLCLPGIKMSRAKKGICKSVVSLLAVGL